jgi:hypothetical protein
MRGADRAEGPGQLALRTVCVNAAMTVKTAHSQDAAIACSAVRHRRPLRHHAAFSAAIM